MRVPMRMIMPRAARRDPEPLIHRHEHHEAHEDAQPEYQVPVRLDEHQPHALRLVLPQEDLGEQVEQGIAQQPADGEGDHDGERGRVDVGGAQGEEEVGRTGDVERREEGVDGGRAREEDSEEAGCEGGGGGVVAGELCGVEVFDDRAGLGGGRRILAEA